MCGFYTVTLATYRRLVRRKRAKARRTWWLHRKGDIKLSQPRLKQLKATLAQHHSRDLVFLNHIQIAMDPDWNGPWKCVTCSKINGKKAAFCDRCGDTWEHGLPHDTQPKADASQTTWTYHRWKDWETGAHNTWEQSSASSRSSSRRLRDQTKTGPRRRKPRTKAAGSKAKGRGKGKQGPPGDGQPGLRPLPPPPAPPPWPTLDHATALASNTTTVSPDPGTATLTQQQQTENREIARLLREAYPDAQTRPAEATAAIERAEQGIKKNVTKSLHSATKALDRAQKLLAETSDARRVHRNSWLAHLTESIKTWETQLETYRKHGAALQEMALKARADIAAARADIQRLSTQETDGQAALAAVPVPLAEEGHQEDVVDSEEEKLRLQLQSILQTCAGSLGVTATSPADVQTIISDEEREERGTNKRPRSVEPGVSQPGQAAK